MGALIHLQQQRAFRALLHEALAREPTQAEVDRAAALADQIAEGPLDPQRVDPATAFAAAWWQLAVAHVRLAARHDRDAEGMRRDIGKAALHGEDLALGLWRDFELIAARLAATAPELWIPDEEAPKR